MRGSDPFELDRKIAVAARAWRRFRLELKKSDAPGHVFESAGAFATPELLRELDDDSSPIGPALRRWVQRLLEQHRHLEAIVAVERAYRRTREPVVTPAPEALSPRELLHRALADRERRAAWLEALARHGDNLRSRRLALWQRRLELRESVPGSLEPSESVFELARSWLDRTDGAFESLGLEDLPALLETGLASAARASYPSRLSLRALVELLEATRWFEGLRLEPLALPERIAPASFARGLAELGAAFRRSTLPSSQPFALAADPFELPERTLGAAFAGLLLSEPFALRKLEVSRHALTDHRRAWAASALVSSRIAAFRLLLSSNIDASLAVLQERFKELSERALGVELDAQLAAVLCAPRSHETARFSAWFSGASLGHDLVQRHDEDWFRNPRAREELRESPRLPAQFELDAEALEAGASELQRVIATAL